MHHGFVGGLLEHTLSVTKNCDYFAETYPILNRDLIVSAAIFHDIGKLEELSTFPENDYTDEGQLLGHIMIGAEMVGERIRTIPGFPKGTANELKHCILAHHGELEYGSPKNRHLRKHWHSVLRTILTPRWRQYGRFLQVFRRTIWSGRDITACWRAISADQEESHRYITGYEEKRQY